MLGTIDTQCGIITINWEVKCNMKLKIAYNAVITSEHFSLKTPSVDRARDSLYFFVCLSKAIFLSECD